jgi:hypothetical protein
VKRLFGLWGAYNMTSRRLFARALSFAAVCTVAGIVETRASPYVVIIQEIGSDVVATGSGQLDLTGLNFLNSVFGFAGIWPVGPTVLLGGPGPQPQKSDFYDGIISGPANFGSGTITLATSETGGRVGLDLRGLPLPNVTVPVGYISDSALGPSTLTFNNATFATLGVTPGIYTWTWGSGADQSFTIETTPTPLPATLPLFATGLGALGLVGWRRKKKAAQAAVTTTN